MWHIDSITDTAGAGFHIFGGLAGDQKARQLGDRLGPVGSTYLLTIKGGDAVLLKDVGNTVDPSAWAVQINATNDYWFYVGEGQLDIEFLGGGMVAFRGGKANASAAALGTMAETRHILPFAFAQVDQSTSLKAQWNADPLATLNFMGLSNRFQTNIPPSYIEQINALMQTVGTDVASPMATRLKRLSLAGPVVLLAAEASIALHMQPTIERFMLWLEKAPSATLVAEVANVDMSRVMEVLESCFFSKQYDVQEIVRWLAP